LLIKIKDSDFAKKIQNDDFKSVEVIKFFVKIGLLKNEWLTAPGNSFHQSLYFKAQILWLVPTGFCHLIPRFD
jgi:hypothetical protein